MPYLKRNDRIAVDLSGPLNAGDLNYLFSSIIQAYLTHVGTSYQTLNNVVGSLECCKMEVYRRIAAPYEDKKIGENGDVFYVEGITTE